LEQENGEIAERQAYSSILAPLETKPETLLKLKKAEEVIFWICMLCIKYSLKNNNYFLTGWNLSS